MAAVDVSAVAADIAAQAAPIVAIGGAVLLLNVGIKALRWVRSALGIDAEVEHNDPDGFDGEWDPGDVVCPECECEGGQHDDVCSRNPSSRQSRIGL